MNMPGFTADASLYRTTEPYSMAANLEGMPGNRTVYLQRATGPNGPIGLPGQGCNGACLHICLMGGFNVEQCVSDCLDSCWEPGIYDRGFLY
jgi:hypothetical protein